MPERTLNEKLQFIALVLPAAIEAIGKQHGWLVRWAVAKAGIECGWNIENALIKRANNCLGIKGGTQDLRGQWHLFDCPVFWLGANTGPEAGERIPWRMFPSLAACFAELVRQWNDRIPYQGFRDGALIQFENAYTGNLKGHAAGVLAAVRDVTHTMQQVGLVDAKGRIR